MIYSVEIEKFPSEGECLELNSYKDENEFEWRIARVVNGFFVGYFGNPYFKDTYFDIEFDSGKSMLLMNSGCFFINNSDFDVYYDFREIIKNGCTDDIWDSIGEFIKERLICDPRLTDCEVIKR